MEPTTIIPAALRETSFSIPISDQRIALSANTLKQCASINMTHLFPVQTAVFEVLLGRRITADTSSTHGFSTTDIWRDRFLAPAIERAQDVLVSAPTGSGKTLGYVLPLIEMMSHRHIPAIRAMVVVPTRDLVRQVTSTFQHFTHGTSLRVLGMSGGTISNRRRLPGGDDLSMDDALIRERHCLVGSEVVDVVVTTPGRLVDHLKTTSGLDLSQLKWLILDEADRLLDQPFDDWLERLLGRLDGSSSTTTHATTYAKLLQSNPLTVHGIHAAGGFLCSQGPMTQVQKLLFSATLTKNPGKLASLHLHHPRIITSVAEEPSPMTMGDTGSTEQRYILPPSLHQSFVVCDNLTQKPLYVLLLIYKYQLSSTLCFVNAVDAAERLHDIIQAFVSTYPPFAHRPYTVAYYSSTLSPAQRSVMLNKFKRKQLDLLICTDALSRGVDLMGSELTDQSDEATSAHVILNYDVPTSMKTYVHRVGRTARAGRRGDAMTIVSAHEARYWKSMIRKHGIWSNMQRLTDSDMQNATTYGHLKWSFEDVFRKYEGVLAQLRQERMK